MEEENFLKDNNIIELVAQYGQNTGSDRNVERIQGEIEGIKVNIQPRMKKTTGNVNAIYNNQVKRKQTFSKKILPSSTLKVLISRNK